MKFKPYPKYKASGVEWLEDVPVGWKISRLKNVAELRYGDSLASENRIDGEFDVFGSNGPVGTHSVANTFSPSIVIGRKGSFGKVTYSDNAAFAIDTTYFVDKRCTESDLRWLFYGLQTLKLDVFSQDTGVPGLSREDAYQRPIAVPLLDEQSTIAAFLDRETAKIDTLITKQEKLIDLLKEKRQAVISHAVTKGLDPTVAMKPSGVEWLGDVPRHWVVSGFTKYLGPIVDYRGRTPTKIAEGVLLLTARNIKNGQIDYSASQEYISEEEYPFVMQRGRPEIGDVLFTMEAPLGQVANIDQTNIALAQRIVKFRGLSDVIDNYYLKYWIMGSACQCQLEQLGTGSTALGIKSSKLGQIQFCFPKIFEQKSIVAYLERTTTKIDTLIAKAQQAIALQKEHRTALISAAVTGKIDVRENAQNIKLAA